MYYIVGGNMDSKFDNMKFDEFVKYCLSEIMIKNNVRNGNKVYSLTYDYDEITLTNNKIDEAGFLNELQSISLSKDEYLEGNKTNEDLFRALLNTIQSTSE